VCKRAGVGHDTDFEMTRKLIRIGTRYEPVHYKRLKAALRRIERHYGKVVALARCERPERYEVWINEKTANL